MANVLVEETSLQNIANSIREKTGTEDTYKPSEMATAISGISTGGGSVPEKGIVINEWDSNGYATDISIVGMTTIPKQYFHYVLYSGYSFFKRITTKNNLHLPDDLISIDESGFSNCDILTSINLPSGLTSIERRCFYNCSNLALTELPSGLTSIGEDGFYSCSKLALTELPSGLTSIGKNAFQSCSKMVIKSLPSGITSIPEKAFQGCYAITELTVEGDITSIFGRSYSGSFYSCTNLNKIAFPNVTGVPVMETSDQAFASTPIINGTGYIYVPDTLVDSFKTATNWSTYADQIKPISEMPTE